MLLLLYLLLSNSQSYYLLLILKGDELVRDQEYGTEMEKEGGDGNGAECWHTEICVKEVEGEEIGKVMHHFGRISTFAIYNDPSKLTQLCWKQTKTTQTWLLAVILRLLMFI